MIETTEALGQDHDAWQQELLEAFQGSIAPVQIPWSYRLGILLAVLVMIALPLIYIGLIVAVGYSIYYHLTHHGAMLESGSSGRGRAMMVLAYAAWPVVGSISILFMLKPLFNWKSAKVEPRSLDREQEPTLFAFVDRVCEAVNAPKPQRIDVDCNINASAGFRRGFMSFLGTDLVLTLGMPLVAGLTLRQFGGVLAHEFGHFSQGAGMRLTYVVRTISHWFTRVVYERDAWDEQLKSLAGSLDLRLSWVLYLALFLVWLTRKILWVLMMIGHAVSGYMLRQMEFDADRYEARVAGSSEFAKTCRQLTVLNVAYQGAQSDLGEFYREGRLGDNLPRLILANVEQLPAEVYAQIDDHIRNSKTGKWDTHPSDKDRIASAEKENAPGIFLLEQPASLVFSDFDAVARVVTADYYRQIFGDELKLSDIHPVDELLARQNQQQGEKQALTRFFLGAFSALRPLRIPATEIREPADPQAALTALHQARSNMASQAKSYREALKSFDQADSTIVEAKQVTSLTDAHFRLKQADFNVPVDGAGPSAARQNAEGLQAKLEPEMEAFESSATLRLQNALMFLATDKVQQRLEGGVARWQACQRLLPALNALNHSHSKIVQLRNEHAALTALLGNLQGNEENQKLISQILAQLTKICRLLESIQREVGETLYPYDHAQGDIQLGPYLLNQLPPEDNLGAVYDAAGGTLDRYFQLYLRISSSLSQIAEHVEAVFDLEPLPPLPPMTQQVPDTSTSDTSKLGTADPT